MTTVKDLIDKLSDLPQDAPVMVTMDEGDNDPAYPIDDVSEAVALREEVDAEEAYVSFAEDFGGHIPEEYQEIVVLWAK